MGLFLLNSVFLGFGLAMDAFSVSLANGLADPSMKRKRMMEIAGIYGVFQFAMPLIGWLCVHTLLEVFEIFEPLIPWIALILLLYIGINMIKESSKPVEEVSGILTWRILIIQGIATSIDALSVGFTIASDPWYLALLSSVIIGLVTFGTCMVGLYLGKKASTLLSSKALLAGGIILILIGIEIFLKGFFR